MLFNVDYVRFKSNSPFVFVSSLLYSFHPWISCDSKFLSLIQFLVFFYGYTVSYLFLSSCGPANQRGVWTMFEIVGAISFDVRQRVKLEKCIWKLCKRFDVRQRVKIENVFNKLVTSVCKAGHAARKSLKQIKGDLIPNKKKVLAVKYFGKLRMIRCLTRQNLNWSRIIKDFARRKRLHIKDLGEGFSPMTWQISFVLQWVWMWVHVTLENREID